MTVRWLLSALLCLPFLVQAQNAEQVLQRKLATIKTFSASFEQRVVDSEQQVLQQGKGQLLLKQPAFFRFETTEPEPNLFIGDGTTLWFYNEMLEQLTLYDAEAEVNRTPFVLLTSTNPQLWAQYDVTQRHDSFTISAKEADSSVKQLVLRFSGDALASMHVVDINGQRSDFNFTTAQVNITLDDEQFQFTPPAGTDIDDQR